MVGCWLLRHRLANTEDVLHIIEQLRQQDRERGYRESPETLDQRRFVLVWSDEKRGMGQDCNEVTIRNSGPESCGVDEALPQETYVSCNVHRAENASVQSRVVKKLSRTLTCDDHWGYGRSLGIHFGRGHRPQSSPRQDRLIALAPTAQKSESADAEIR